MSSGARVTVTPPALAQAHDIDRAGIFRRAGIIGRHHTVADAHGAIPMAERHVIGASGGDVVVADQPGRPRADAAIGFWLVMAVRHGDQPAGLARAHRLERNHVVIVAVRPAPDFEREIRKSYRVVVGDADDVQVFHRLERAVAIDRAGDGRIVIAGQDDDRQRRSADHRRRLLDQALRHAMAVESIAGEQHHVGCKIARRSEHAAETRGAVAAMEARGVIVVDVQVGAMNDDDVAGGRKRHARSSVGSVGPSALLHARQRCQRLSPGPDFSLSRRCRCDARGRRIWRRFHSRGARPPGRCAPWRRCRRR